MIYPTMEITRSYVGELHHLHKIVFGKLVIFSIFILLVCFFLFISVYLRCAGITYTLPVFRVVHSTAPGKTTNPRCPEGVTWCYAERVFALP